MPVLQPAAIHKESQHGRAVFPAYTPDMPCGAQTFKEAIADLIPCCLLCRVHVLALWRVCVKAT